MRLTERTLKFGGSLLILDGESPLRRLDLASNVLYTAPQTGYCKNVYIDLDGTIKPRKNPTPGMYFFDGQFFYRKRGDK